MTDKDLGKLGVLKQEKSDLRLVMTQHEMSTHKIFFIFLGTLVPFAGIYFNRELIPDDRTRALLIFSCLNCSYFWHFCLCGF